MAISKLKPKIFSGTSHIFDGTLESTLNEIIDGVNGGGGGAGGEAYTDADAIKAVAGKAEITALQTIADPATATAEQVATLLNSIVTALKAQA